MRGDSEPAPALIHISEGEALAAEKAYWALDDVGRERVNTGMVIDSSFILARKHIHARNRHCHLSVDREEREHPCFTQHSSEIHLVHTGPCVRLHNRINICMLIVMNKQRGRGLSSIVDAYWLEFIL